jgi:hypothetical protein
MEAEPMDVWLVSDESKAETDLIAVFDHAPSPEELDSLGPLRQHFSETLDARGRPYTTREVRRWEARGREWHPPQGHCCACSCEDAEPWLGPHPKQHCAQHAQMPGVLALVNDLLNRQQLTQVGNLLWIDQENAFFV